MTYGPPPLIGDVVWCANCRRYQQVAGDARRPAGLAYKSVCRSCRFSRNAGNMRMAILFADTHRLKWHHAVDINTASGDTVKTILPIVTKS